MYIYILLNFSFSWHLILNDWKIVSFCFHQLNDLSFDSIVIVLRKIYKTNNRCGLIFSVSNILECFLYTLYHITYTIGERKHWWNYIQYCWKHMINVCAKIDEFYWAQNMINIQIIYHFGLQSIHKMPRKVQNLIIDQIAM